MYDLEARIERMYRRDRHVAILLVVLLTATLAAVFATVPITGERGLRTVLGFAGTLLVLFNGASIAALLRHNREDRTFIYTLDIKHLDEHRAARSGDG